jgi:hypothetical protein
MEEVSMLLFSRSTTLGRGSFLFSRQTPIILVSRPLSQLWPREGLRAVYPLQWAIRPYWALKARPEGETRDRHTGPVMSFGPKIIIMVHIPPSTKAEVDCSADLVEYTWFPRARGMGGYLWFVYSSLYASIDGSGTDFLAASPSNQDRWR